MIKKKKTKKGRAARKKTAEVFTPTELVLEMLAKLALGNKCPKDVGRFDGLPAKAIVGALLEEQSWPKKYVKKLVAEQQQVTFSQAHRAFGPEADSAMAELGYKPARILRHGPLSGPIEDDGYVPRE